MVGTLSRLPPSEPLVHESARDNQHYGEEEIHAPQTEHEQGFEG
jgi:hypothetical protein